ncbi:MAG TPA: ABC transporter substrate-binding protein [Acetobacteraceae bacterium]|jgi:branched-chain amino acid transport system substrate-binding protein
MTISRRALLGTAAAAGTLPLIGRARAQSKPVLKIGVLNDLSGPYMNTGGPTSIICAKQAVEEFAAAHDMNVEVIAADHQNKPDLAVSICRQWFDRDGVDVLMDVPTSSVALAVQSVVKDKNKVFLAVGPASTALTGAQCSPNFITWVYDTYMLAKSTGGAMVKAGGDSWYFLTADYAFGKQLQSDTTGFVKAAGGKVLGSSPYPFPGTSDFSSFLVQAQSSGAKVLGLANAGGDTVNSIKQANEFGVNKSMKLAALLMFITDVHALGLATAKGLVLTESYYWDMNEGTRNFCNKIKAKSPNNWPNMIHAGCYSATLHYLKTAHDMGAAEAKKSGVATVARMKKMPVEDECFGKTTIREDGRHLVPAYLFEVKAPAESKGPWDYYKLRGTTPAEEAARPLSEGGCSFIGKA